MELAEDLPTAVEFDIQTVYELIAAGDAVRAWQMLPSVVRRELMDIRPLGAQWSPHVEKVINRLTQEGSISIIAPIVTKDSDGPSLNHVAEVETIL